MNNLSSQKNPESSSVDEKITPKVGGGGKLVKYLGGIFMLILVFILVRGFFEPNTYGTKREESESPVRLASASDTPLNLNLNAADLPVVPTHVIPPPLSILPSRNEPADSQQDETRLKSPTQVFNAAGSTTPDAQRPAGVVGGDPNSNFLQQASNLPVITVTAKQNTNMEYKILQGKLISAVLETSIDSDMPGMARAVVNKDVYGDTGNIVLLPKGTRLIGQYNSVLKVGQTRLMAAWTRAITPNHVDIALGSPSADELGRGGMGGDVDTHFWKIFGTSALLSVLGAGVANNSTSTAGNGATNYGDMYQNSVTGGLLNSSSSMLQSRMNIQPTIHVPQGSLIQVFVARDLDFSTLVYSQ